MHLNEPRTFTIQKIGDSLGLDSNGDYVCGARTIVFNWKEGSRFVSSQTTTEATFTFTNPDSTLSNAVLLWTLSMDCCARPGNV